MKAQNCAIKDIQKGNQELLQKTYHSRDFMTDDLYDTHTRLQHAQDELTAVQSYVHHLETELHERDKQLEVTQAQAANLQPEVEHLQELIPQEPEEDPEEIEGISCVEDH
jgi:peptidoglycan hydrolase CwlO-like protein